MTHPEALNDTPEPIGPGQPQDPNPTNPGDLAATGNVHLIHICG